MISQRVDRGILPRQFGLSECRMDLVVTDLVQQDDRTAFPAAQLWNQVVQALLRIGWYRATAERADRQVFHSNRSFSIRATDLSMVY